MSVRSENGDRLGDRPPLEETSSGHELLEEARWRELAFGFD